MSVSKKSFFASRSSWEQILNINQHYTTSETLVLKTARHNFNGASMIHIEWKNTCQAERSISFVQKFTVFNNPLFACFVIVDGYEVTSSLSIYSPALFNEVTIFEAPIRASAVVWANTEARFVSDRPTDTSLRVGDLMFQQKFALYPFTNEISAIVEILHEFRAKYHSRITLRTFLHQLNIILP